MESWFFGIKFLKKISSTSKMSFDICTYSGTPLARPHSLDGTQLVVSAALEWSRHTCILKGFMYHCYSLSLRFYNSLLEWKLFSFARAYRYCSLYYKIAQRTISMSAVQIPQELTISVCYVTLAATALALTPTSLYPPCFRTTWCNWASCCWQVTSFPA